MSRCIKAAKKNVWMNFTYRYVWTLIIKSSDFFIWLLLKTVRGIFILYIFSTCIRNYVDSYIRLTEDIQERLTEAVRRNFKRNCVHNRDAGENKKEGLHLIWETSSSCYYLFLCLKQVFCGRCSNCNVGSISIIVTSAFSLFSRNIIKICKILNGWEIEEEEEEKKERKF